MNAPASLMQAHAVSRRFRSARPSSAGRACTRSAVDLTIERGDVLGHRR